jgi:hypothetical protein
MEVPKYLKLKLCTADGEFDAIVDMHAGDIVSPSAHGFPAHIISMIDDAACEIYMQNLKKFEG